MGEEKIDLGFDWNRAEEWEEYRKEIGELYKAMHRYISMTSYLRNLDGVSVTYGLANSDIFYNEMTEPKTIWNDFIRDFYEVYVEQKDVGYGEKYRIKWSGGGFEIMEDYSIVYKWVEGIHGAVMNAYLTLTQAGFKADNGDESYDSESYLDAGEVLVRNTISLSPLVNRKTFFLLSLRYLPEGYARMMYGDIEKVRAMIKWRRLTAWKDIPNGWQIHAIADPMWKKITDALYMVYGYVGTPDTVNTISEMWRRMEKYIDMNPYNIYFSQSINTLSKAYGENIKLYDLVKGSWQLGGGITYAEVSLKSLRDYGILYWAVVDEMEEPKTMLRQEALIKFVAPQMFLNIATMYINVDGNWVIGMWIPKTFLTNDATIEYDEIDAVVVHPPYVPREVLLPKGWAMHKLRDFIQEEKSHLDWLAMQTPEWEDFGGE